MERRNGVVVYGVPRHSREITDTGNPPLTSRFPIDLLQFPSKRRRLLVVGRGRIPCVREGERSTEDEEYYSHRGAGR